MNWDKLGQWFGGFMYAAAAAVAGGAVPVSSHYAWVPAALGVILRNMTDSNATQTTTKS